MSQSIFERIVAGELPCHRVFEDEHTLAFLDIEPVADGHTLLIPKRRFVELDDVPADVAAALGAALPKLVAAVKAATGCAGVNVLQNNGKAAGQAVMHVHFHLIPRGAGSDFDFNWLAGKLEDARAGELVAAMARVLRT